MILTDLKCENAFSEHWILCNIVLRRCHNCLHTAAHSASTDSAGAWVNKPALSGSNFTSNGFLWFKIVKTVFQTSSRHSSPTFKQTWEQWWRKHCQNEWEREIDLCESDRQHLSTQQAGALDDNAWRGGAGWGVLLVRQFAQCAIMARQITSRWPEDTDSSLLVLEKVPSEGS